jgi:RNA polymerase sigma-70 factor, ECF subfamily
MGELLAAPPPSRPRTASRTSLRTVRPPIDDVALVQRIREQDPGAFVLLYMRYAPYLARVVQRLLGHDDDIDDILQESFADAFAGIGTLRDAARLRWWLATIAIRRVQSALSVRRRQRGLSAHFARLMVDAHSPASALVTRDLQRVLDTLPEKLLRPWVMSRIEQKGIAEVAAACSISVATAKRRVASADERVRKRLEMASAGPLRRRAVPDDEPDA